MPTLPDDRLSLTVFGPGFGESCVLRIPPAEWVVIDSLVDPLSGANPALELLEAHGARPTRLILTHPHDDHASDFHRLIEAQGSGPIGCVAVHAPRVRDVLTSPDTEAALVSGRAEHALAAIFGRWDADPSDVWKLTLGDVTEVGEATLTVLAPRAALVERRNTGRNVGLNSLSAPLAVKWHRLRLVLGADLPAVEWKRVAADWPASRAGDHAALKVPHHGSRTAQPELLALPDDGRSRCWTVTPWNRGRTLPRFEDGEGVDALLDRVDALHLTSLPRDVELLDGERRVARRVLNEQLMRRRFGGDDMILEYERRQGTDEAWVSIVFSADGAVESLTRGPAAVTILP